MLCVVVCFLLLSPVLNTSSYVVTYDVQFDKKGLLNTFSVTYAVIMYCFISATYTVTHFANVNFTVRL